MRAFLHTVAARIRGFLRPGAHDSDFDDELAAHLAMAEEDAIRRGVAPDQARRAARIRLGGVAQLREASRAASGLPWLESVSVDVKLGVRLLFKYPGLTIVSTLALSIAIAVVAGFHAGTEFMVRPTLPVPEGDRIVAVWNHDVRTSDRGEQTVGDMVTWRRQLASLQDVGAFARQQRVVADANGATRLVRAAAISPSAFQMVRIPPLMGRPLVDGDERPGAAVAVVGFDLWQSAFGGDAGVVGKSIRVGGLEHTVVGIMPAEFRFPVSEQLWTPLRVASAGLAPGEGPAVEFSVGRLAPGVTLDEAQAELQVIGSRIAAERPGTHGQSRPRMTTYARSLLEANEPGLATMMSAARVLIGIVLLVVAVNVGTLVYARDASRVGEVAVRTALGATRSRIVLQMLLEALVLASLAAAVGLAIMAWPLYLLREVLGIGLPQAEGLPFWFDVRLGPSTMLVVVGLVLLSAALTGMLPALKLTDRATRSALQRVQAGASGLRFGTTATSVIVSQVAISVALLTVGASQLRTFVDDWRSLQRDETDRAQYLAAQLRWDLAAPSGASGVQANDALRRADTWRVLGRRLSQEPDVRGVTFDTFNGVRPFAPAGIAAAPAPGSSWSWIVSIEPNYFDVYETSIRAGRVFDAVEATEETRRVAIVNEAFVRTVLQAGSPIGQRIHPVEPRSGRPAGESLAIVGVVADSLNLEISQRGPGWVAHPTVYVPLRPTSSPIRMTVRTQGDPTPLVGRLQAIAAGIDSTLVVHRPGPLENVDRVDQVLLRLYGFGVGFVIVAVLLLSTAGVYSMLSFTVSQRTREIGIRTALGASPGRVTTDVLSRAFTQIGSGTLLGLAIGYAASAGPFRLSDGLFDKGPGVMIGVAAVILLAGLGACGTPLRRALRIQPTEALRTD
ncbi:MAG TPA: ABC transporter permease [Vicinamibacterales bacterium]|nr:ABC transporter permease [Vicinamibacterales bacterium]